MGCRLRVEIATLSSKTHNDRGRTGMTYGGSGDEREGKDGSDKSVPYLLYRFDNRIYFL